MQSLVVDVGRKGLGNVEATADGLSDLSEMLCELSVSFKPTLNLCEYSELKDIGYLPCSLAM